MAVFLVIAEHASFVDALFVVESQERGMMRSGV